MLQIAINRSASQPTAGSAHPWLPFPPLPSSQDSLSIFNVKKDSLPRSDNLFSPLFTPVLLDREMPACTARPPPAGDTPPYEKGKHLPNKGPGLYSFPLSRVGILSLCWTSLEKSSLRFDADTLQHSSKLSMVLQGKSRIQSVSYHFIYLPLRDRGIYANPGALFISAFAHSCSIPGRRRSGML